MTMMPMKTTMMMKQTVRMLIIPIKILPMTFIATEDNTKPFERQLLYSETSQKEL
jgi:hypothetical protein